MKLWFVEPKPNVFVSGIKDSLADKVTDMLMDHCPANSGLLIFKSTKDAPFYRIYAKGIPAKTLTLMSGFQLIFEKIPDVP